MSGNALLQTQIERAVGKVDATSWEDRHLNLLWTEAIQIGPNNLQKDCWVKGEKPREEKLLMSMSIFFKLVCFESFHHIAPIRGERNISVESRREDPLN